METFRTTLPVHRAPFTLTHADRVLLAGSCFTEQIGARLQAGKFACLINPFGIVYNPLSMVRTLERLTGGARPYTAESLIQHGDLWHSWDHHGKFSHPDRQAALDFINTSYAAAADFLKTATVVVLTFGTADIFIDRATGQPVANNHKLPADAFERRRLWPNEMVEATLQFAERLETFNPGVRFILTVSPVRHARLGLIENQRSKAALVLACAELEKQLPRATYFPAYEFLLDDLRDYRFYGPDLVHPTETAVDYIWEGFQQTFFSAGTRALLREIAALRAARQHRPLHPATAAHRAFLQTYLEKTQKLAQEYPHLSFAAELEHFAGAPGNERC